MTDRNEKNAARERMEIIRVLVSRQAIDSKHGVSSEEWKQRCATQLCGLALAEIAELFRYQVSGSLRDVPAYLIHREAFERGLMPREEDTTEEG